MSLLKIGTTELAPLNLTELTFKPQDIDGANTGRGETGKMLRDRVRAGVMTVSAKWEMVPTATKSALLALVEPAEFSLSYNHDGTLKTGQFYAAVDDLTLTSHVDGGYWSVNIQFVEY